MYTLCVLREFPGKLYMLLFVGLKTSVPGVFNPTELTHFLHEVLCYRGFKVYTPAGSQAHVEAILAVCRRGKIEQLQRAIDALI